MPADPVNTDSFNTEAQIFNENAPSKVRRFLTPLREAQSIPGIPGPDTRPRVLRDFTDETELPNAPRVAAEQEDLPREPLAGSFTAVRAARILHQHRIGFWSNSGIIETITGSLAADPSREQIDDLYDKFLVFSYLPAELTPTREEFADIVTPSKLAAVTKTALFDMGILITPTPPDRDNDVFPDDEREPILQVKDRPFAITLNQFCSVP